MKNPWTETECNLLRIHSQGDMHKLCLMLGRTEPSIRKKMNAMGISRIRKRKTNRLDEKYRPRALAMLKDGKSAIAIAEILNLDKNDVYGLAKDEGVNIKAAAVRNLRRRKKGNRNNFTNGIVGLPDLKAMPDYVTILQKRGNVVTSKGDGFLFNGIKVSRADLKTEVKRRGFIACRTYGLLREVAE